MEIKTLIVDDEPLAREEISFLLREFPDLRLVGQACNGVEAVEAVRKHGPDLMFLDIQMPGIDGFGVIRSLLKKGVLPQVVFVTAYDEYAVKAFEVNAIDYLLKPIEKRRLAQAIEKVRKAAAAPARGVSEERIERLLASLQPRRESSRKMTLKVGERFLLVDFREVVFATVDDGVVSVTTDAFTGIASCRTIDELQKVLPTESFWRAHRSYLLNINRVREVLPLFKRTYYVKMNDPKQTELPVSRAQIGRLKELFRL